MNEPFRRSSREEKVFDEDGNPIPIFSASRFSSCSWNHYSDLIPEKKLPVSLELGEIFDLGNETHLDDNYLKVGSRDILEMEEYFRVIHESEKWGVAGLLDYDRYNFDGKYIQDNKSTKFGGFFFFLKEGIKMEDKRQMSIYAYMKYVHTGTKRHRGVIRKIDKVEPLNILQLATDLFPIEEIRKFLIEHPVVLTKLGYMTEEKLIEFCVSQMSPEVRKSTGEHWRCMNCQYANGNCPVRQAL